MGGATPVMTGRVEIAHYAMPSFPTENVAVSGQRGLAAMVPIANGDVVTRIPPTLTFTAIQIREDLELLNYGLNDHEACCRSATS